MRLDNPVANNAARLTPPEGIQVDGTYIPGGISVRVPGYVLHRSEAAFERPEDFIPGGFFFFFSCSLPAVPPSFYWLHILHV